MEYESSINNVYIKKIFVKLYKCYVEMSAIKEFKWNFFFPVVWGECNHSFHLCCMTLWVKQNKRCPLCQQDWEVQRIGK